MLQPPKGKGVAVYTPYVDEAARIVAATVNENRESALNLNDIINQKLEIFHLEAPDCFFDGSIREIRFSDEEKNSIEVMYFLGEETRTRTLKKSTFIRKIRESFAQLQKSRQSRTNY